MRRPSLALVVLFACLFVAAPRAGAATQIFATTNVTFPNDPGFEGLYKYDIKVTWHIDPPSLGRADVFVQLGALDDSCGCVVVRFDQPAGSSDGSNCENGDCELSYRGKFLCSGNADNPAPHQGAAARWKPRESDCGGGDAPAELDPCSPGDNPVLDVQHGNIKCTLDADGSGHFIFYSSLPPGLSRNHADDVSIRHGNRVETGDLFGSLPGESGAGGLGGGGPVVINEFLVKPKPGDSEFIELFNNTGAPVDISGWRLEVNNGGFFSEFFFPDTTVLPPGGFEVDSTAETGCIFCAVSPPPLRDDSRVTPNFVGEDFLFDKGGVIQLFDATGAEIDRVGYGNLGGAPISCPLIVPAGASPPPGFMPQPFLIDVSAEPDTISVSTNRTPNGTDTGVDPNDFNVGLPSPDAANTAAQPDLGGSLRISGLYVFPRNNDGDPKNESVGFFNPLQKELDLAGLHLSDGTFIQPMLSVDHAIPLEPGGELTFYHGLNATISFEFEEDSRMDVYEARPEGLVRVDQIGWSQLPTYFPDSCLVRVPEGTGPTGGWDWVTSGGDVNLFYRPCDLEAIPTATGKAPSPARVSLESAVPNPARGDVAFEFVVTGAAGKTVPARVGVFDVAGRLVRYVGTGFYTPGRYRALWDGRDQSGASTSAGVYFARVLVGNQPGGESRPIVRIKG
jgi:hypothetical protein